MSVEKMKSLFLFLFCLLLISGLSLAQSLWNVPFAHKEIQVDGFLEDWTGVPELILAPAAPGIHTEGVFGAEDLKASVRAAWDKNNLYLAVEIKDDTWDTQAVTRREAAWLTPDRRRRDRMLFFDNFKFSVQESDYDYTFWISPRVNERGPFFWNRLLQGLKGMEMGTAPPSVTARFRNGVATMEILLVWDEMRINAKANREIPLTLLVSDSDMPGKMLETKLPHLKWVEWKGMMVLTKNAE